MRFGDRGLVLGRLALERGDKIFPSSVVGLVLAVCTAGLVLVALSLPIRSAIVGASVGYRWIAPFALGLLLLVLTVLLDLDLFGVHSSSHYQGWILLAASVALFVSLWSSQHPAQPNQPREVDTATIDSLTGASSHRAFQDRLTHECDRAYRFGDNFMLAVLDLDNFHQINDRHGHRIGDKLLAQLATRLHAQLREIDLVARFGGDQFAMILPHTYQKGGCEVGERLRKDIAAWTFVAPDHNEMRLTASLGLCSYPQNGTSAPELVDAAFTALRFAKAMGGNQIQSVSNMPGKSAKNVIQLPYTGRGAIVRSLAAAVDIRDGYTREHSRMVSELSAAIARGMGLPDRDVDRISVGGLLHDVGKIGVPDSVLTKSGSLTPEEVTSIRQHPVLGKRIIEQAPELADVMPLVLYHQEHFDGSGYPEQLKGEQIPLGARIIATADAYHAIRSNRPYRSGRTHAEATDELTRCAGRQFDPRIVQALLSILESNRELQTMAATEPHALAVRPISALSS